MANEHLVNITKLARHGSAGQIFWIAMNLHATQPLELEANLRQRSGRFRREALARMIASNPIADLAGSTADAPMAADSAEHLPLIGIKNAIEILDAAIESRSPTANLLDLLSQRDRFLGRPRHPCTKMIQACRNRLQERRRIG